MRRTALVAAALAALALAHASPARADGPKLDVPNSKFTLDNGMVVILAEDHALPMVVTNLMVKVGSRFEEKGRTGFAHLFEHLMFMGTNLVPTKMYDGWMEKEGGWNNANTGEDRTDYYDVGPARTLPLLLWLEADRFGALGKEMTLDKLNAQREVVRNERRQTSENTPYGKVELRLPELLFPDGHPYHHPVIGSHADLQAAEVKDVQSFFARWYVPNNVTLCVAGDFDPADVKARVTSLFGTLPRGDVPAAPAAPPSKLTSIVRETMPDNVQMPKIIMAWQSPAHYAPGDAELDLVSVVLDHGKASRLYKALVYDKPIAQEVHAEQHSLDVGGYFTIEAIPRKGVTLDQLEAAIDAELAKLLAAAPGDAELQRAKNQFETGFVERLQSLAARAALLNDYQTSQGDPNYADKDLARYRAVTSSGLLSVAKATLTPGARVILRVVPKDPAAAGKAGDE
ncbi:MAG TPA: pitrilysin family protein [Byssovorax sp.]